MSNELFERCFGIASHVFGRTVLPSDSFYGLGGDSIQAIELLGLVEDTLGLEVNAYELVNASNFGDFFQQSISAQAQ